MRRLLLIVSLTIAGAGIAFADERGKSSPNHSRTPRSFMSQQPVSPFSEKAQQPDTDGKQKIRPGRNFDNPAANRFGDATLPNIYVPGHPGGYNLWISEENR